MIERRGTNGRDSTGVGLNMTLDDLWSEVDGEWMLLETSRMNRGTEQVSYR